MKPQAIKKHAARVVASALALQLQRLAALPYTLLGDGGHAAFCFIAAVLMASCASWPAGP